MCAGARARFSRRAPACESMYRKRLRLLDGAVKFPLSAAASSSRRGNFECAQIFSCLLEQEQDFPGERRPVKTVCLRRPRLLDAAVKCCNFECTQIFSCVLGQ